MMRAARNWLPTPQDVMWLDGANALAAKVEEAEDVLRSQVLLLRSHGVPWRAIGAAVGGVSAQAAQQRFGS